MHDPSLILASVSLAFQLFSGCIVAFELVSNALLIGSDAERYLTYLSLQEFLLFTFAKQSGIIDRHPEPDLDYDKINKWLAEIELLLTDIDHLKKRYGFDLSTSPKTGSAKKPSDGPRPNKDRSENLDLEFLYRANLLEERQRILLDAKALQRVACFPKKLWWSAIDRKKFKEFIADLAKWIQSLNDLLDLNRQRIILEYVSKTYERAVANTNKMDRLEDLFFAFLAAPNPEIPVALSRLKALHLAQFDSGSIKVENTLRSMDIPNSSITSDQLKIPVEQVEEESAHSALLGTVRVVIDWKRPRPEDIGGTAKTIFDSQVQALVRLLQIPKPEEFCALPLRGYLNDLPRKWGYVFNFPSHVNTEFKCESLYDLFHRPDCLPSLTDRMRLAQKLASALYLFHTAGWLHKAISSHNIVFFTPKATMSMGRGKPVNLLERPFIIGFDYSRLEENSEGSEKPPSNPAQDIYRHPKAQYPASLSNPFKAIYDIYSLGVVFMELAYWRRIESVLRDEKVLKKDGQGKLECTSKDLEKIPSILLELSVSQDLLKNVPFRVGDAYSHVITTCLTGKLEGSEQEYHKGLQDDFLRKVISPLKERRL